MVVKSRVIYQYFKRQSIYNNKKGCKVLNYRKYVKGVPFACTRASDLETFPRPYKDRRLRVNNTGLTFLNLLSPNSDQDQYSPYNIGT